MPLTRISEHDHHDVKKALEFTSNAFETHPIVMLGLMLW
jgi:hypothetical protein